MEKETVEQMKPQPTWFFEGADGKPFAVNEKEAWDLLTNKSQWRRHDLKMLGASDGQTYHETIKGAGGRTKELQKQIADKKSSLDRYIKGHDKLMFEDFLDEDDPKVQRAKEVIAKVEAEIDPLEKELKDIKGNLVQKAFNAELEKARGNMQNPRDFSVIARASDNPGHQHIANHFAQAKRVI
jgi:hypothetical protein